MARSSSARLTVPLLICGEGRSFMVMVMVLEQCYGPRQLRTHDDDDDALIYTCFCEHCKCHLFVNGSPKLHCLVHSDLCEDIEVKQQIAEIIETVRNRHKRVVRESGSSLAERRRSSARRYLPV